MSRWKEELPSYEEPDEGVANLKRHGNKVDYIDMQNSVYETLVPTKLVVRDCFVDVDDDLAAGIALDANANRGQFIALGSSYNTNLDLTVEDCDMQTTRSAETVGYTSVIDGNGTQIVKVVIRNNTFGTEENPVDGFAIKFGRRQNGAEIAIEGNAVYGATVGSTEYFSILDLWQSGGNSYDGLTIAMKGNALFCEADADSDVYIAEVEASVNGTGHTLTMSGNTINGEAAGADRVLNGAAEDGGSDLAVVEE